MSYSWSSSKRANGEAGRVHGMAAATTVAVTTLAALLTCASCGSGSNDADADGSGNNGGGGNHNGQGSGTPEQIGEHECDMTGVWVVAQVSTADAMFALQQSVNWFYHDISQTGDTFTINKSLNCGFRVTGTTTVTLADATLEALALKSSYSVGRRGTFKLEAGTQSCKFDLDRVYNIMGADPAKFLTDHWTLGSTPIALSALPTMPKNESEGMEDWDNDGIEGITQVSGMGNRYVAERDWNEHHGTTATWTDQFNADQIEVTWDAQESVSTKTSTLLRITARPVNPGRAWWGRVGSSLVVVETGDHPALETCKNVQRLALQLFPNP